MDTWIRRIAVAGATAGTVLGLVTVGAASAQDKTYAPVTLSPEQVKKICEERLPRIEERIGRLTTRVNGGPEVHGSTAWLKAQAQKARDAGNSARAERLERRVERRGDQLTRLGEAQKRVDAFRADHCGAK